MPNPPSGPARNGFALREHQATRLIALSFDSAASPHFSLGGFEQCEGGRAFGWGFAWYPDQGGAALLVKDATSVGENAMTKLLREWERFESTTFLAHLRGAARILQERDTHPFGRAHGGRDWVFAHNGDLDAAETPLAQSLFLGEQPVHEPIGRTDSEHAFCWLLTRAREVGARTLADIGWERLHAWMRELDALGTANLMISDGRDLVVYADEEGYNQLSFGRFVPPEVPRLLGTKAFSVGLEDARDRTRTVVVFSTVPLAESGFQQMAPGQMVVVRRGAYVFDSHLDATGLKLLVPPLSPTPEETTVEREHGQRPAADQLQAEGGGQRDPEGSAPEPTPQPAPQPVAQPAPQPVIQPPPTTTPAPSAAPPAANLVASRVNVPRDSYHARRTAGRVLSVRHRTTYRYSKPVERSSHVFRLQPVHNRHQELLDFSLRVSVDGLVRGYEDVFGNWVVRADLEKPFGELVVAARSIVRVNSPESELYAPYRRFNIPLVWMPWQRQMMTPYLLPPELPETQLRELSDFAMSFVERQDYDLVQTLLDMNTTLHRDFAYASGSTTMATTPFDVFTSRQGVCQDFANLLICLARLLGIPARYRVGYIYTGGRYDNAVQSDASHAWAELYLPWTGWQGFDPTNGVLANDDHVLVACGRNYGDATPTSGTLFKGGEDETLEVDVKVEEIERGDATQPRNQRTGTPFGST